MGTAAAGRNVPQYFHSTWAIIKEAASDWIEDKASQQGAALAFYSVLSLAPLVIIALKIASLFVDDAGTQFMGQMQSMVGQEGAEAIGSMVASSDKEPKTGTVAAILGVMTLLVGASGVFGQLQQSMNTIWDAEPKKGSG